MEIRRAMEEDSEAVLGLLEQVNLVHHLGRPDLFKKATKYSEKELLEIFTDDDSPVFVALQDGEVLGYAFCIMQEHRGERMLADIRTLYIDDICVDEKQRGKGVGRALYEHVLGYARERACHNVTLNVWELNPDACAFYRALGMQVQKYGMETILE